MHIKTISNISISEGGCPLHEFALRQGDLDGACGPYSLMMALLLSKGLTRKQALGLWSGSIDKRTTFAKIIQKLDALVSQGMSDDDLKLLFKGIQKLVGTPKVNKLDMINLSSEADGGDLEGLPLLEVVKNHIDNHDKPVILTLNWSRNESHWVVAIGYQTRFFGGEERLENILTLDPDSRAGNISPINAWNGVLGKGASGNKKLRYTIDNGSLVKCTVTQGIGFKNLS